MEQRIVHTAVTPIPALDVHVLETIVRRSEDHPMRLEEFRYRLTQPSIQVVLWLEVPVVQCEKSLHQAFADG
jgi:hypothetical protein